MSRIRAELFERDRPRWLRLATVLTGEPSAARTLLASATLRRPRRTDRDDPAGPSFDDAEEADLRSDETARQLLLETYLGRRLGWAPPLADPTPPPDEPDAPPDEPVETTPSPEPEPPLVEPVETTPSPSPSPGDFDRLNPRNDETTSSPEPDDRDFDRLDPRDVETTPSPDDDRDVDKRNPRDDEPTSPPDGAELTRRQRAALVLVCFEELTETEAARVLELTQPVVHTDLAAALSALGLPAGRTGHERARQLLRRVADQAPDSTGLGGEVRRQQASRRRFRSRVLAGATAVVVLVAAAVVLPEFVLHRLPVTPREPGELVMQFEVVSPEGWGVVTRGVSPETDHTILSGAGTDAPSSDSELCMFAAGARGVDPSQIEPVADRPAGEDVRIHGRPGQVHEGVRDATVVSWQYADEGTASVRCTSDIPKKQVLDLARSVRWRQSPVLMPFRWPADGPAPDVMGLSAEGSGVLAWINVGDKPENVVLMFTLQETRLTTGGDPDGMVEGPNGGVCRVQDSSALCADLGNDVIVDEDGTQHAPSSEQQERALALTRSLLADLELADLDDRETWFDAREAFPS